jgi:hypothetical protein
MKPTLGLGLALCFLLDASVQLEVISLGVGDDAVAHNARPELFGHGHRVLMGSHGQGHLVARGLEGTGEVQDALELVIYLLGDEKHTHLISLSDDVAAGATREG